MIKNETLLLHGGGDLVEDAAAAAGVGFVFLVFLALFRVVFGQRPEDRTAQRAQHAVAAGLVASKSTRGAAGHGPEEAAVGGGAIGVDGRLRRLVVV